MGINRAPPIKRGFLMLSAMNERKLRINTEYLRFLRFIRSYFDGRPISQSYWRRQYLAWVDGVRNSFIHDATALGMMFGR